MSDAAEQEQFRQALLADHLELVCKLIPVNEKMILQRMTPASRA